MALQVFAPFQNAIMTSCPSISLMQVVCVYQPLYRCGLRDLANVFVLFFLVTDLCVAQAGLKPTILSQV